MKDWVTLLTAIIQMVTAIILLKKGRKETKKKGTKHQRPRKR